MRLVCIVGVVVAIALSACGGPPAQDSASTSTIPAWTPSPSPARFVPTTDPDAATATPPATETPLPTETSIAPTQGPVAAPGLHPRDVAIALEQVAAGLSEPTGLVDAGDVAGRLYILEKRGMVRVVENGSIAPRAFLDIFDRVASDGSENGLLGLAFHPGYLTNGVFYVYYTNKANQSVLSRFSVIVGDFSQADRESEFVLLTIEQPTPEHNGGRLVFGPDGYLYVGIGDGGGVAGEFRNQQGSQSLLGTILRLDVDNAVPYAIPFDNPFIGNQSIRDEIWATGLRNPWGYSFDFITGDLYIADVGEVGFEEVNFQPFGVGGQNYGWPSMEGKHCYGSSELCNFAEFVQPIVELDRTQGCAVVGGHVYRARRSPSLIGTYLFGDFCEGRIWGLRRDGDDWQLAEMLLTDKLISAFGQDRAGEVYVLDFRSGGLFRISGTPC